MPRYYRRRRRGGWAKTARVLAGGKRFGKAFVKHAAGPIMASLAKRFIKSIGTPGAPLGVSSAAASKTLISQIPRNITGTDEQQENRVGRKVYIKGVTLVLRPESTVASANQTARFTLVRQSDPTENQSAPSMYAPFGATSGQQVLWDKYVRLGTAATTQANDGAMIKKYVKVGKKLLFAGTANDGTDADEGSLVLYMRSDEGTGFNCIGSTTVHYRELL